MFNDLLFESAEAQAEFDLRVRDLPLADAERLRSVLGKPSQFVGRVMTYGAALRHWEMWEQWQREEQAASITQREPSAPRSADPARAQQEATIAVANKAWRDAVIRAKQDSATADEWCRRECDRIKKDAEDFKAALREDVRVKRNAYTLAKTLTRQ